MQIDQCCISQEFSFGNMVKTIEDARRPGGPPLILGSTAEGTSSDAMGILLREWLGFNLKVVAGYTDSTGSDTFNLRLSEERAEEVKKVLNERGVKDAQMLWKGFGEQNPVADNTSTSGRSKNRRVELKIDVPQQQPPQG